MRKLTPPLCGLLTGSVFFMVGCAAQEAVPEPFEAPPDTAPVALHPQHAEIPGRSPVEPVAPPPHVPPPASAAATARPDAVITQTQSNNRWTREVDQLLSPVVSEVQADERILIRLHGHAPTSGSNGMSIAMADPPLRAVRDRLQALGISSARILSVNYGQQFAEQRDPSQPWIEVFLIRPNASR